MERGGRNFLSHQLLWAKLGGVDREEETERLFELIRIVEKKSINQKCCKSSTVKIIRLATDSGLAGRVANRDASNRGRKDPQEKVLNMRKTG